MQGHGCTKWHFLPHLPAPDNVFAAGEHHGISCSTKHISSTTSEEVLFCRRIWLAIDWLSEYWMSGYFAPDLSSDLIHKTCPESTSRIPQLHTNCFISNCLRKGPKPWNKLLATWSFHALLCSTDTSTQAAHATWSFHALLCSTGTSHQAANTLGKRILIIQE